MHLSSMDKMRYFRERYLRDSEDRDLTIFDLGSRAIGGSYREIFSVPKWTYVGADLTEGENVDLILSDPYNWLEVDSRSVDVLISGQTFEHIEFFWVAIREIVRILKPGGLCCIIAPSSGPEHRYPVDCWRFYPDGFRALGRYAGLELLEVETQWEPEGYNDGSEMWKDTFFVGRKPERTSQKIEENHIYKREIEENSEDSLSKIIRHISPNSSVLELGPATGYLTRFMTEEKGCVVDCVEISPEMAKEAERFCNRMEVRDLDIIELKDFFQEETYDYVILADVLEHLRKGERTLRSCRKLLKKSGHCIVSIPNIAHASIIGELLKGRFDYRDEGLLDRSHIRFFTCSSIQRLLNECGFGIEKIEAVVKLPEDTETGDSLMNLPIDLQRAILSNPDTLAYQYVIVCSPTGDKAPRVLENDALSNTTAVDLRRLVISGLEERITKAEDELEHAQNLAYERLDRIRKLENTIKDLEDAFHEAQRLAFERLDRIQEMQSQIQAYEQNMGYRLWKKVENVLGLKSGQKKR